MDYKTCKNLVRLGLDQDGQTPVEALQRLLDYEGDMLLSGAIISPILQSCRVEGIDVLL